ncbi:cytochrome c oxidase assembly protein subunit 15 [Povalibacter uvarum]|uniref:Cytochrome c oxidase assembly protein subunit 15 n=1 Tax=Povalibacter uvarum TaxID=732238 RepID=A0A841HKJ6_9GAMM|nr:COX15/CtaA family protein [Povalibacter uvarum]MBB6093094.1 cytochrome c oxidase assembly protein subunit 15 [Povalibacter uvarum]
MTSRLRLFRRLALAGVLLTLVVVVLGAWVRLSAAGLGCPDWPGCYGHLTADQAAQNVAAINEAFPHRPFEYHKAVKEMVHRYFASTLGLLCVVLAGLAIANRKDANQPVALPIALVGLVIFQGLLGMWTVTLLLKPLIVVLHLLGGLATLCVLTWLAMEPERRTRVKEETGVRRFALAGLVVLVLQIALGGWTSSNYAALACPDFPTCQNVAWPEMDMKDAFVLWRGLGIDYEGGVLDHPARVAIHFVHRLGAIVTALMLGVLAVQAWRKGRNTSVRVAGAIIGAILVVQLILGPVMVMRALPLILATAHNGVAALLLLSVVRINRLLRPLSSRL